MVMINGRKTFHGRVHLGDLRVNDQYKNGSYINRLFGCGLIELLEQLRDSQSVKDAATWN
jgi:hypothetical protein